MKKCLFLVEGPFDRLRLSAICNLFDENKLIIIPFGTDYLQHKDYCSTYIEDIKSLLNKEHLYEIDDFDEIVEVCDTDGCFVDDEKVIENKELSKTRYMNETIEVPDRNSFILCKRNKMNNISEFLSNNKMVLFYNSTNVDHAFDNIQNPTDKEKRICSLKMAKACEEDKTLIIKLLKEKFPACEKDYQKSWEYIMKDCNSLNSCSNVLLFLISHKDDLKEEYKELLN